MSKMFCSLFFAGIISFSALGCGSDGGVPEDAPPTPEPNSAEYDSYNNAGKSGPATEKPAEKKGK